MLLSWLRTPMASGIDLWDLQRTFPEYVVALSHLAELAENDELRTLATERLDEMFSWLARNSFQGVYGSSHRRARALAVKSGRLAATSGISRLLWGMGAYNRHIAAVVSLASSGYRLPPDVAQIALDLPQETWQHERYSLPIEAGRIQLTEKSRMNLASFKTADYMLASMPDYRPGQPSDGEHIWQATLGPDALVYVTHPANMSEKDAHRNGFWHGNATLPRVAQWKDTLVAAHKLPQDDWMGFTHAYWPTYAFDEQVIRDRAGGQRWAFARKGDGYIALTAARGIELVDHGLGAYRELRSYGRHNVWLCLMGRAASDGSFEAFQRAVLAADVEFGDLAVRLDTLRGETLTFGWKAPLRVTDRP